MSFSARPDQDKNTQRVPRVAEPEGEAQNGYTVVRRMDWRMTKSGQVYVNCPYCVKEMRLAHKIRRWGPVTPEVRCPHCKEQHEYWLQDWPYVTWCAKTLKETKLADPEWPSDVAARRGKKH